MVEENILDIYAQQKMLCVSNATEGSLQFTVPIYHGYKSIDRAHKISNRAHPRILCQYSLFEHSGEHKRENLGSQMTIDKAVINFKTDPRTEIAVLM